MQSPESVSDIELRWDVRVPMRDGVSLSAHLYLPVAPDRPRPAIVKLTPYVAQTYHDEAVYYAERGYPFLVVDVRGRGNSPGTFRPNVTEARDGADVTAWIADQPFCDGRVTAIGGSYSGLTQWLTAAEGAPALATIVPVSSPMRGIDTPVRNNLYSNYSMQWLTLTAGRTSQDKIFWGQKPYWGRQFRRWHLSGRPFREIDRFLGMPAETLQEWIDHPTLDEYWDSLSPSRDQYASISIPVLTITGHYDVNQPGALGHYRRHLDAATPEAAARHFLVIGPWNHQGTREPLPRFSGIEVGQASLVDLRALHLAWYAWTMEDGPRPEFLEDRVMFYVTGEEQWRSAPSLDAVTGDQRVLHLASDGAATDVFASGRLEPEAPTARTTTPDEFLHDPADVTTADLESLVDPANLTDQRMLFARRGRVLVYHSAPLPEPLVVAGFFRLSIWIAIDQPDADFKVSVHAVDLEGRSRLLSADTMRARYRESTRHERLITTTDPLLYVFGTFPFVAHRLDAGHRLRLVIEPIHSIYLQRNFCAGGVVAEESVEDARVVRVAVWHDPTRPSALTVPLARPTI